MVSKEGPAGRPASGGTGKGEREPAIEQLQQITFEPVARQKADTDLSRVDHRRPFETEPAYHVAVEPCCRGVLLLSLLLAADVALLRCR